MEKETEINDAPAWYRKAMDVPYEDHMVNVEGVDIHYLTWGEAGRPGLVFVHGGAAHAHWWTPWLPSSRKSTVLPLLTFQVTVTAEDVNRIR